jgi:hypothetical protein
VRFHLIFALALSTRLLPGVLPHAAASTAEVLIITHHINPKRNAETGWETAGDCLRNSVCGSLLKAGAVAIGVPTGAVEVVKLLVHTAKSSHYALSPPDGYQVCHVQVRTVSVVPASADRASGVL